MKAQRCIQGHCSAVSPDLMPDGDLGKKIEQYTDNVYLFLILYQVLCHFNHLAQLTCHFYSFIIMLFVLFFPCMKKVKLMLRWREKKSNGQNKCPAKYVSAKPLIQGPNWILLHVVCSGWIFYFSIFTMLRFRRSVRFRKTSWSRLKHFFWSPWS